MTIPVSPRRAGPFDGNGLATQFPFNFKIFADTDILVVHADALGAETELVINSDYSVTIDSNNPGGSITYPLFGAPMPVGEKIVIVGNMANDQPTDIQNLGGFYPEVIEDALDRAVIQIQQLAEQLSRAFKAPVSGDQSVEDLLRQLEEELQYVTAVYNYIPQIDTVAQNIGGVNTVAGAIANVNAVGQDISNVNAVAGDLVNLDVVAGDIANVNAVGQDINNVNTVAGDIANVNAVVANKTNIDAVAGNEQNIDTVAGIENNVNTVAANIADVNTVASIETDVQTVAGISGDVQTVSANEDVIKFVGDDLTGQPIVIDYGDLSPTQNPASPQGVIGAVWNNEQDISAVAADISSLVYVAQNLAAILSALSGALVPANNLSDLHSIQQARVNLGIADMGDLS